MHEPERRVGAEDLRPRQGLHRPAAVRSSVPGQRGHRGQRRLLAEHRDRSGHGLRRQRQSRQARQHGARDGARTDRPHGGRPVRIRRHALGGQRRQQPTQQQRIADGDLVAGER